MSKFTPGPWEATDDGDIRAFIPEYGCRMSLVGDGEISNLADAKLMAAAPDLLALLVRLEFANIEHSCSGTGFCPLCGEHHEHAPDCELAALLKRFDP